MGLGWPKRAISWMLWRWAGTASPPWFAPVLAILALALALLAIALTWAQSRAITWASGEALIGLLALAWVAETGRLGPPRHLFAAALLVAVAALIGRGGWPIAPLFLMMLVAWYGYLEPRRRSLAVLACAWLALAPYPLLHRDPPGDWLPWAIGMAYTWISAYALARQRQLLDELRSTQAHLMTRTVLAERSRIAREIHDVVAHSLTVTMLHITGARHTIARDPQAAAEALARAEQLGRQSLGEIRRTVELLDDRTATGTAPPMPGLRELPELIADFRAAGLGLSFEQGGDVSWLSPALELDLYRIAQEALTNILKHAPAARAEVVLQVEPALVVLRVLSHGPPGQQPRMGEPRRIGRGLVGMRERVALYAGTLRAGPVGAGWLIECRLPRTDSERPLMAGADWRANRVHSEVRA